jgi:glycosyl transferase family 25
LGGVFNGGVFGTFNRVYVINLPARRDRALDMRKEFRSLGVDPDAEPIHWFAAVRPDDAGGFSSIGARGCFMSHLGVLEDASARGFDRILIVEDDVDFLKGFSASFPRATDALGAREWSFFYDMSPTLVGKTFDFAGSPLATVPPDLGVGLTHFVGIRGLAIAETRDYLRRMLERPPGSPEGGPMHVDGAYGWFRRAHPDRNTLVYDQTLTRQRPSRTDIHDIRWFDRTPAVRDFVGLARRVKRALTSWAPGALPRSHGGPHPRGDVIKQAKPLSPSTVDRRPR